MPSALFSVNGSTAQTAHTAAYASTVSLALDSTADARKVDWSILSVSKSGTTKPVITSAGTTATFPLPADPGDGLGRAFLVQCQVNDGRDSLGRVAPSLTVTRVVGTANDASVLPLCPGETVERDATQGWTDGVNFALKAAGGGIAPVPADPGDDGKELRASGGAYTLSTPLVPTPADPGDDGKIIEASGGSYGLHARSVPTVPADPGDDGKAWMASGGVGSWTAPPTSGVPVPADPGEDGYLPVASGGAGVWTAPGEAVSQADASGTAQTTDATETLLARIGVANQQRVEVGAMLTGTVAGDPQIERSINAMCKISADAMAIEALDGFVADSVGTTTEIKAITSTVSDLAIAGLGLTRTISSALGELPDIDVGDVFVISGHSEVGNNARWVVATVVTPNQEITALTGAPVTASAESVTIESGVGLYFTGAAATTIDVAWEYQVKRRGY